MNEKKIVLPDCGKELVLKRPLAKARNDAMIEAEEPYFKKNKDGSEEMIMIIKQTKLMIGLIPHCIKSHNFGTMDSISILLERLTTKDYDYLRDQLSDFIKPEEDVTKKSSEPSE